MHRSRRNHKAPEIMLSRYACHEESLCWPGCRFTAWLGHLRAWPVPIDLQAWTSPVAPALTGPYEVNERLAQMEWLCKKACVGSEDVAVADEGRILRREADGSSPTEMAKTEGHPLGLQFDPDGNLIIADAYKGLLRMNVETAELETLATEHDGLPLRFTDNVDVGTDGTIYFTDTSFKWPLMGDPARPWRCPETPR